MSKKIVQTAGRKALGEFAPEFAHLPLILKPIGNGKLSKRDGDKMGFPVFPLEWKTEEGISSGYREKGFFPEAVVNFLALLGWNDGTEKELFSLEELAQVFNVKRINTSGAIFDIDKLTWMNGMYLRNKTADEYYSLVDKYISKSVSNKFNHKDIAKIVQQRANTLTEISDMVLFFDNYPTFDTELYVNKKMKTNVEIALPSLKAAYDVFTNITDWNETTIHDALMSKVEELGIKNGQLLYPVRIAITGTQFTPGGAIEISYILGKEETLNRLKQSINQLEN